MSDELTKTNDTLPSNHVLLLILCHSYNNTLSFLHHLFFIEHRHHRGREGVTIMPQSKAL